MAAVRRSTTKTGGGPSEAPPLSVEETAVLSTMHPDAYEGIKGGIDSGESSASATEDVYKPPPQKKKKVQHASPTSELSEMIELHREHNALQRASNNILLRIAEAIENLKK